MTLVKHGERIQKQRRKLISLINAQVEPPIPMKIDYQPSLISKKRIQDHRSAAIAAGFTLIGPQKDDFEVKLDLYQSQGRELRNEPKQTSNQSQAQKQAAQKSGKQAAQKSGSSSAAASSQAPANYQSLDAYGSRGEKRMGVVWLKKAELAFLRQQTNKVPVLLLDDILSELDQGNQQRVLNLINNEQVIITTVNMDLAQQVKQKLGQVKVIKLTEQ